MIGCEQNKIFKLPLLPKTPSDGLLLVSEPPMSVGSIVERGGTRVGTQAGSGGVLEPSSSEIKSIRCFNTT